MKKAVLIGLICFSAFGFGQSKQVVLKKYYKIPNTINDVKLQVKNTVSFAKFGKVHKIQLQRKYKLGDTLHLTLPVTINGMAAKKQTTIIVDKDFYQNQKIDTITDAPFMSGRKGYIKYDEESGKLFVNPYLKRKNQSLKFDNREDIYFYQLKNRDKIKINFSEISLSAFTIPFKYRFKNKSKGLEENISTALSVGVFAGVAWGSTSFLHRKKIGVKEITQKCTFGILFGGSTVTLNTSNTSLDPNPLAEGTEIVKGLASIGFGAIFSRNGINLGALYGWDFAVGNNADKWNYKGMPWIGLGVGIDIF